jgi:hypothetical protein
MDLGNVRGATYMKAITTTSSWKLGHPNYRFSVGSGLYAPLPTYSINTTHMLKIHRTNVYGIKTAYVVYTCNAVLEGLNRRIEIERGQYGVV